MKTRPTSVIMFSAHTRQSGLEGDGHAWRKGAVDAVLRSDETDVQVCLVGQWDSISEERMPLLADPALELRLIAATYRSDPRVRLLDRAPASAFPSPYLLTVPVIRGLGRSALSRMIAPGNPSTDPHTDPSDAGFTL